MWAHLVLKLVDGLDRQNLTLKAIEQAVDRTPWELDELYNSLITGMDGDSIMLIRWVCFAIEPLSIMEMQWALLVGADPDHQSMKAYRDDILDIGPMKARVTHLSRGLVEVTSNSHQVVQFVHQSVKDYFMNKGLLNLDENLSSISETTAMTHHQLSKICIRYLRMDEIGDFCEDGDPYNVTKDYPFLRYATTSWVQHRVQCEIHGTMRYPLLPLLGWPPETFMALWLSVPQRFSIHPIEYIPKNTTLAHIISRYGLVEALWDILQENMEAVVDTINSKDDNGQTTLSLAARYGHEAIVKLLVAIPGVNINSKDDNGRTPLSYAAMNGYEPVAKLLVAIPGVDVNSKDDNGRTPLSYAAMNGYESVAKLLVTIPRVNVNSKDNSGRTPFSYAAMNGYESVAKLLVTIPRVNVNSKDNSGRTPLSWAAIFGHKSMAKLLVAMPRVDVDSKDNDGRTPFSYAAMNGYESVAKLLVTIPRVNVNSKDNSGRTPLSWAAIFGHKSMAKLLVATPRVDVDSKDNEGWTPLSYAAMRGHESVAKILVATPGVDIDLKDKYGRTPLSWAVATRHKSMMQLLGYPSS
ncbi:unnamed protein product [Parascedosporium putredinis]|uniref:Ankyrin repeat protein n=1 Tax=Parascedosporium putredinis TaxID=1442378 RepID=A0A9P1GWQ7_9PEZI|nr:unnamed protein product [Parascedosporium putredinis]CAI7989765.1 unnamed protein product [Parascedosporium putredinis]